MDLIIKNASLEEITTICYRIGEPNFQEMVEANRKFGVVEYLVNQQKADINAAAETYDNNLQNAKIQVAIENDLPEEVEEAEEVIENPVTENTLHVDKAPEVNEAVDLKENIFQLASKLMETQGPEPLTKIFKSFNVKSLPELNKAHYEEALAKIKEALNGNA